MILIDCGNSIPQNNLYPLLPFSIISNYIFFIVKKNQYNYTSNLNLLN